MYLPNQEDWQPINSIIGFEAFHAKIGKQMYKNLSGTVLAKQGIFFYDSIYRVPRAATGFGAIQPYALPALDSCEWPIPTIDTSEAYWFKIYKEVQNSLRGKIGNRQVKISFFMPLQVYIDLFSDERIRRTLTMLVCKSKTCLDFLEKDWDIKNDQGIICKIMRESLICKHTLPIQNFIVTFRYARHHFVRGIPVALDQNIANKQIIDLEIYNRVQLLTLLSVTVNTSLEEVHTDLAT